MFYKVELQDHIRVPPDLFGLSVEQAVIKRIKKKYDGFISKDLGVVIDVAGLKEVKEGMIIPGDGASYYDSKFELIVYKPELQEVIVGDVKDITEFGAFINLGPIEGMVHVSQTMDDFVSFSKDKVLMGKESKKSLRVGDKCRARLIAVSYKDASNPKFGLTMRQEYLGKLDWAKEEPKENKSEEKKGKREAKEGKA